MNEYKLFICFKPEGKKRARLSRHGVYSPSKKQEVALGLQLKEAWDKYNLPQITADIRLKITYIGNYYNIKIKHKLSEIWVSRKRRCDVDNYEKFVLDAFQKSGIIKNDVQICKVLHGLEHNDRLFGVEIEILDGGFKCIYCGHQLHYEDFYNAYCPVCIKGCKSDTVFYRFK